ncbi:hypothetical protein [Brevibacterium sp. CT2-23B]|uniref:hypothetical protein n=1 Tax=Brevibacterium sp. CT2-23B TaxID=2729630 RepID=UPI0015567154|nr:hypothetical protein [Brevibacterium sp. CT2-23B]
MAAKYFLVKYVPDPRRQEPRNVGVVVENDGDFAFNFIGKAADGNSIDGRKLRKYGISREAFSPWIEYIQDHLDPERFATLLSYRERKPASIWVELAGHEYVEIESAMSFSAQLFNELVATSTTEHDEPSMKQRIETIFDQANIDYRQHLRLPGRFGAASETVQLPFDYGVRGNENVAFDFASSRGGLSAALGLRSKMEAVRNLNSGAQFAFFYARSGHDEDIDDFLLPVESEAYAIDVDDEQSAIATVQQVSLR